MTVDPDTPEARLRARADRLVFRADADSASLCADIRAVLDRLENLRKLDVEYCRVEAAIIMADPEFDGDSPHANCGDRLIASVERLAARAALQKKDGP